MLASPAQHKHSSMTACMQRKGLRAAGLEPSKSRDSRRALSLVVEHLSCKQEFRLSGRRFNPAIAQIFCLARCFMTTRDATERKQVRDHVPALSSVNRLHTTLARFCEPKLTQSRHSEVVS